MIIGLGSDLMDIRRIERSLERFGDRFVQRVFTGWSRSSRKAAACAPPVTPLPPRKWAKALGTGIARGVSWKEIGVINLPGGKPTLAFTGRALERLIALTPEGMEAHAHITITDDHPYAQAFVVIEARLIGTAHG